ASIRALQQSILALIPAHPVLARAISARPQERAPVLSCQRSLRPCRYSGCRVGISSAPPTRPLWCKLFIFSQRAAAPPPALPAPFPAAVAAAGLIPSPAAALCIPIPSSTRSHCRGTWAVAGLQVSPLTLQRRPARKR